MLLVETLPSLTEELQELLAKVDRAELASQIPALNIVDRCGCGDNFCASFYTQPKPNGSYGPDLECFGTRTNRRDAHT
jgi:hypothetical protein